MNTSAIVTSDVPKNQKELEYYDRLHKQKYRDKEQTREQHNLQLASNLATGDNSQHFFDIYNAIKNNRFIAAGRIQAALGATEREVSPFNCSVSQKIEDNIDSIYKALHMSAKILRLGTGIGYNFSHLRPKGALVKKLQTESSGPVSYMELFNTSAALIASSGHRRGAQMGIINVDHPDIELFIDAKMEKNKFRYFNFSVGITEDFMHYVRENGNWQLIFNGEIYKELPAAYLWEKIVRNAYESAEPGLVFLDKMNEYNNLWYCEHIEATNPCSEQPLPEYGLCTLGSFNLMGYIYFDNGKYHFNLKQYEYDIKNIIEAYDNIFDKAVYAIPEHKEEALNKRRIGLGLTGISNAIELLIGEASYGNEQFCEILNYLSGVLNYNAYATSVELSQKRGAFPLYNNKYLDGKFIKTLPDWLQSRIYNYGIRNSHLISYAPCGTISQIVGNVSSGVEPIFYHKIERDVFMKDGLEKLTLQDYNYREFNFKGKTLEECSIQDHLNVTKICQSHCDSAVSKTINVPESCSYKDYERIYQDAYGLNLKGITVFRPTELRGAVIRPSEPKQTELPLECDGDRCQLVTAT